VFKAVFEVARPAFQFFHLLLEEAGVLFTQAGEDALLLRGELFLQIMLHRFTFSHWHCVEISASKEKSFGIVRGQCAFHHRNPATEASLRFNDATENFAGQRATFAGE